MVLPSIFAPVLASAWIGGGHGLVQPNGLSLDGQGPMCFDVIICLTILPTTDSGNGSGVDRPWRIDIGRRRV